MQNFSDDPISSSEDDRLDRTRFALLISEACVNASTYTDSSVLGLIGPWGSGKTSILNLVRENISSRSGWQVINFNPWLFSSIDTLLEKFFSDLAHMLPASERTRTKLASYLESISPVGRAMSFLGSDLGEALKETAAIVRGDTSAEHHKEQLEKVLRESDVNVLVVVDDIDRLQPAELLVMFKLIRLVGRLPRVHYLISFDETTVLDLLERSDLAFNQRSRAQSYLEKIVQVRLDLPPLKDLDQWEMFFGELEELMADAGIRVTSDEEERIFLNFNSCMRTAFRQPRAIKRLLSQFQLELALTGRRLDVSDHLAITYLRVFEPGIYSIVQWSREDLAPRGEPLTYIAQADKRRQEWLEYCAQGKASRELTGQLASLLDRTFPTLRLADSVAVVDVSRRDETRRVSSAKYFDEYFQLSNGATLQMRDFEIALVELQSTTGAGSRAVKRLTASLRTRPNATLFELDALREAGKVPHPAALIHFLSRHYATVVAASRFDGDPMLIAILANGLFKDLPPKEVVQILADEIANGRWHLAAHAWLRTTHSPTEGNQGWEEAVGGILRLSLAGMFEKMLERKLRDITDLEFSLVHYYARLDPVNLKEKLAEASMYKWPADDFLARIVSVQRYMKSDGSVSARIQGLFRPQIEQYFDLEQLQRRLRRKLAELPDTVPGDTTEATFEARRMYALSVIRLELQKASDTSGSRRPSASD